MSIPASSIVSVVPGVLAAGGNPLALNGLFLTQSTNLPVGNPVPFTNLASVLAYFGQYAWSGTATCSATTLTVVSTTSGSLAVGQQIQGSLASLVPPGTYITGLGTYTALSGVGTVTISGAGFTQATATAMTSNSLEYNMASTYFNGYTNSSQKPTSLYFSRYITAASSVGSAYPGSAAFLRGTSVLSLIAVQAQSGNTLTLTINGTPVTSGALTALSSASSFSIAAAAIQAAFAFSGATLGTTITYSSLFNAFVVQTAANATVTSCAATSILQATGTAAAGLGLTAGTISPGAAVSTPAAAMTAIQLSTQNWAIMATCFEPVATDKQAFATWINGTNGQFAYACYDTDSTISTSSPSASCIGIYTRTYSLGGTIPIVNDPLCAAGVCGAFASVNYNATNGRISLAFKSFTGVAASIVDPTSAANCLANEYNFYGAYATANQGFNVFYNGQISGAFSWADSYVNAIWLNSALQLALMNMFTATNAVPYNNAGYAQVEAACWPVLQSALNAGVINTGVVLTAAQIAQVNSAAGIPIDQALATRGFYLQVLPASGNSRNNRTTPPCTLWYMDGGSINQLSLASIDIQ